MIDDEAPVSSDDEPVGESDQANLLEAILITNMRMLDYLAVIANGIAADKAGVINDLHDNGGIFTGNPKLIADNTIDNTPPAE